MLKSFNLYRERYIIYKMKLLGWMVLMSVLAFRMETMRNKDLVSALVSDETEVEFENVRKILTSGWQ